MANSKYWRELTRQVKVLRRSLLPVKFDPLGQYKQWQRVNARTRAFLVLSHAEIEVFLENWASDITKACETSWNSSGIINAPLAYLIATLGDRFTIPEDLAKSKDSPQQMSDGLIKLFRSYNKAIRNNHGIRERNVHSLYFPLGVPGSAFGATLLPNLDSLGKARGDQAHQSGAVIHVLDPETQYQRIKTLLIDLDAFDKWLIAYRSRIS